MTDVDQDRVATPADQGSRNLVARVIAALEPVVAATAERALATPLDAIGAATFRADIASMRHETQYTRLFRS